jgi:flagellar biosynthesis protein FliR
VVGRAVPQINIFVISFNVNMLIGLFVFMVSIPLLLHVLESDFMAMGTNLFLFLKGF